MARPPIDPEERKTIPVTVMVTADQKAALKQAADDPTS